MRKEVVLPSGILGHIPGGKIHIDLEMTAHHYDQLTLTQPGHYEETVLSILTDLMDEDPHLLTQSDLQYVFTLVKISSVGSSLKITVSCPSTLQLPTGLQRVCGQKITVPYSLAKDDDVEYCLLKERPTFNLEINGKEETFSLQLPTMSTELSILDSFVNQGIDRKDLLKDKTYTTQYAKQRMVAHLISTQYTAAELMTALEQSSFATMNNLAKAVGDISRYGLRHKVIPLTCPTCGGVFDYHLPLFAGLSL